jgi:SAM-dependent methyltransferase
MENFPPVTIEFLLSSNAFALYSLARMKMHYPIPKVPTVERTAFLLEACRGKRVLHLGCTDWPMTKERFAAHELLHQALLKQGCEVVGLDMDAEGVEFFNAHGLGPCILGNVETVSLSDMGIPPFELILAGEIIEHLENPGLFLRACHGLLAPGGELLVTTINAYSLFRFLRYALGCEYVHPDHNYYFSPKVLETLAIRCGYSVTDFWFHGTGTEKRPIAWHYRLLMRVAAIFAPYLADGVIIKLRSNLPTQEKTEASS